MSGPKKVLVIDGGGIRGIIPARILAEIERRSQKPICRLFDLLAGTSTGGILTLGLTVPGEPVCPGAVRLVVLGSGREGRTRQE